MQAEQTTVITVTLIWNSFQNQVVYFGPKLVTRKSSSMRMKNIVTWYFSANTQYKSKIAETKILMSM